MIKIIRWKFVLPVAVFIAAVAVFFILFFDPLLERGLEAAGAKLNGARVDIDRLQTKFLKGRLSIDRIQVADRGEPMTNRVEAGPIVFQMNVAHLLTKRVVIPESSIDGILFGTERKKSGALPKKIKKKKGKEKDGRPGITEKIANKYKNRFKLGIANLKSDAAKKIEFDEKELALTKKSNALKEKAEQLPQQWENNIDSLNFDGRLKQIGDEIENLKNISTKGLAAAAEIPKALETLKETKVELNQMKADAKTAKTSLFTEINTLKSEISELNQAKDKDVNDLMSRLNLDFADPERFVEGLIGEAVLNRVQTSLRYIELARTHLPSSKEKKGLPKKVRAGGMDVSFPRPKDPPRFWLQYGKLTGRVKDVDVTGTLAHLTNNPARAGEPLVLNLSGQKGTQFYKANITADHVGEQAKDSFTIEAKGLPLDKMVSSGLLGASLTGGESDASIGLMAIGKEKIGGQFVYHLRNLKFDRDLLLKEAGVDADDDFKAELMNSVAESIENMKVVNITAKLLGTWSEPDLKLTSNLKEQLSGVIKSTLGKAASEQRKKLESRLNAILAENKSDLTQKVSDLNNQFGGRFDGLEEQINRQIEKAAGISLTPTKGIIGDLFK